MGVLTETRRGFAIPPLTTGKCCITSQNIAATAIHNRFRKCCSSGFQTRGVLQRSRIRFL